MREAHVHGASPPGPAASVRTARGGVAAGIATCLTRSAFLAATVAYVSSCDVAERNPVQSSVVDTLPSGRVLVSSADREMHGEGGGLRLVEELRIGDVLGEGPGALGDIVSLAVDGQGVFYVGDQAAKQVLVFDAGGTFVRGLGRAGGGPGEFRWLLGGVGIAWQPPDRLWVSDPPFLSVMGTSGLLLAASFGGLDLGTAVPPRVDQEGFAYYGRRLPWTPGEPVNLAALGIASIDKYAVSDAAEVVHAGSLKLDPPPTVVRQGPVDARESAVIFEISSLPMQPEVLWAIGPDGHAWVANTSEYRVHEVTFAGDTLRTVELRREPDPLVGAERDSLAEAEGFEPDELPAFRRMFDRIDVAPDGYLWVHRRLSNRTFAWDVFDPCGRFEGTVAPETPLGWWDPFVVAAGGVLVAVTKDELDLEYVVRMQLQRPEGASAPAPC